MPAGRGLRGARLRCSLALRRRERNAAEIQVIPSEDGISVSVDQLVDAIDERTALVAVSHVSYLSSFHRRTSGSPILSLRRSERAL